MMAHMLLKKIKAVDPHANILVMTAFTKHQLEKNDVSTIFHKPFDVKKMTDYILDKIC